MKLALWSALAIGTWGSASAARAAVQLPFGRYIGWIQADGTDRKVALTLDTFVEQPNDPTLFPQLDVIVKASLGGPKGTEYTSEYYENASYDYTDGILSLSGEQTNLSMTLKVASGATTTLDGSGYIRSAGLASTIHLELYDPGHPGAPNGGVPAVGDDAPLLSNQYVGVCNGQQSYLQLETGRGLGLTESASHGLIGYAISGRFGTLETDLGLCLPGTLCSQRSYHDSNFDQYSGRLVLNSDLGTDTCQIGAAKASCEFHIGADTWSCDLLPQATAIPELVFYTSPFRLSVNAAQKAALPAPNPPANAELISALGGGYIGYLYNEATDHYQVMRLDVVAYSSTNNPHNLNLVYVTGGATLHFGDSVSADFYGQPFEARSFYLSPGFTLESPDSDGFMQVTEWDAGYVRGIWYSHAFGRVGTFELGKGSQLPALDPAAKFVPPVAGSFAGPVDPLADTQWWLAVATPNQPAPTQALSTFAFTGDYMLVDASDPSDNLTPRRPLKRGEYDLYSGALSFLTTEDSDASDRLVQGRVNDDGTPSLIWPDEPQIGRVMSPDHSDQPFTRR